MPVNYLPLIFGLVIFIVPVIIIVKLILLKDNFRSLLKILLIQSVLLAIIFLFVYLPGYIYMYEAHYKNDPKSQYELSRWYENHADKINSIIMIPFLKAECDVKKGFEWLNRSADNEYPEAIYALGIMYKYGIFVPDPSGRNTGGNYFPQPEKGQQLIDKAIQAGYKPNVKEEDFYYLHFMTGIVEEFDLNTRIWTKE